MKGVRTWTACAWVLLGAATAFAADEISHDDGKRDTKRSTAGSGHAVRFERPSGDLTVTAVRIHGERYGGRYDPFWAVALVRVCDADLKVIAQSVAPYELWKPGKAGWAEVPVAPTRVPARFHVLVDYFPAATKGVYQSVDSGSSGHSWGAVPGSVGKPLEGGDWMIRVVGVAKPPKVERPDPAQSEVLARGSGDSIGKLSSAGSGHAVAFKAPAKKRLLTRVSLFGQRYGGGYRPGRTLFHVFVCDKKLRPIARTAGTYDAFSTGALGWVDVDLPPVKVPRDFVVLVAFEPTSSKGVYLGKWAETKAASLTALPGEVQGKAPKGEGWMIRATVNASLGKQAPPPPEAADGKDGPEGDDGPDAAAIAETLDELDELERAEDVEKADELARKLIAEAPDYAQKAGRFSASKHFLLRQSGMTGVQAASLLRLMEAAHDSVTKRFGFARVSAHEGKRTHLHVTVDEKLATSLFTDPGSAHFSRVVMRGPPSCLRAPGKGGPHVVYGLCHELGHVLIGWTDSRHKWAHYLGSVVASDVHEALGERVWWEPYDVHAVEGTPRYAKEIAGAEARLGSDAGIARLFHEVGEKFGTQTYGKAVAWIIEKREGEPFHAVRRYSVATDLRDGLVASGCDEAAVNALFRD